MGWDDSTAGRQASGAFLFSPVPFGLFFLFPETPADEELAVKSPLRQESSTVAETF